MYTHLEPETLLLDSEGNHVRKVSVCVDSAADIPLPENDWASGSSCFVIDTQDIKFLNSQGEWV